MMNNLCDNMVSSPTAMSDSTTLKDNLLFSGESLCQTQEESDMNCILLSDMSEYLQCEYSSESYASHALFTKLSERNMLKSNNNNNNMMNMTRFMSNLEVDSMAGSFDSNSLRSMPSLDIQDEEHDTGDMEPMIPFPLYAHEADVFLSSSEHKLLRF